MHCMANQLSSNILHVYATLINMHGQPARVQNMYNVLRAEEVQSVINDSDSDINEFDDPNDLWMNATANKNIMFFAPTVWLVFSAAIF